MPNCSKQMAEMTIANESEKTYMFKMKSTRPGMFKMRPVYGAVQPNEKTTVRLIFKGLKPGQEAPRRERFTIVTAVAPSATVNTEKVWKMQKYQEKLCEGDVAKKKFRILFFGVNDQEEDEDEKEDAKEGVKDKDGDKDKDKDKDQDKGKGKSKEKASDKDKEKDKDKDGDKAGDKKKDQDEKKKIEEVNPKDKEKEKISKEKVTVQKEKEIITNVIVKKEFIQAPQRKLVVMMYRDRKDEDSLSGDDDGDDISAIKPVAQHGDQNTTRATFFFS
ncbi:MSP domain protein [Ancylostoma caninum]|uniref:Major sperm protein n=1 Tax=Ancylostoma caninum TaxID=29170 RepID=A0A368H6Z6_ANCCA|nr:MSP domain protein [Ancylostoma caninum]